MKRLTVFLAALVLSVSSYASLDRTDLPADTQWYLHLDLSEMRSTDTGQRLYSWLKDEVLDEVREETGFDADQELNQLTAYGLQQNQATVVLRGPISQQSQDKLIAALALKGNLEPGKAGKYNYYRVDELDLNNESMEIEQEELYFSFDRKGTLVISTNVEDLTRELGGKISRHSSSARPLLLVSANRELMQAGVHGDAFRERWDSGMLRNATAIAVMLADDDGNANVGMRITAKDEQTSNALASVVRGLIGLQALSDDIQPAIRQILNSLKVSSDKQGLSLELSVDPMTLTEILD